MLILLALLSCSAPFSLNCSKSSACNKTFFTPRESISKAIVTSYARERRYDQSEDSLNGFIQPLVLYQASFDNKQTSELFGINRSRCININSTSSEPTTLEAGRIISARHTGSPASFSLDTKRSVLGAVLHWYQPLETEATGFFFALTCPVLEVKHTMHLSSEEENNILTDFFAGLYNDKSQASLQKELSAGKIESSHTRSGFGDIDVCLGYRLSPYGRWYCAANAGVTLPLSNKSSGEWLYEALLGGGHYGVGFDVESDVVICKHHRHRLSWYVLGSYRYLLPENMQRLLGLQKKGWHHYYKAAHVGQKKLEQLFPLANVLHQEVEVKVGSRVEALTGLSYYTDHFGIDLGYSLFYKESEKLRLKNAWPNGSYALVTSSYNTSLDYEEQPDAVDFVIERSHIDVSAAATPALLMHMIYGSIGYTFANWDYPLSFALSGTCEIPQEKEKSFSTYTIAVRMGINF